MMGKGVYAVAGGDQGAGKTTTVAALGTAFAAAGRRTLLVDLDSSTPTLAERFDIAAEHSVHDVLTGDAELHEAYHDDSSGIVVLPGETSDDASSAVTAERLRGFLDATDEFDVVLLDTGRPFVQATKAALNVADGVVVVSTPGETARRNTAVLHEYILDRGCDMVGTVLTRVRDDDPDDDRWDCSILATIPEADSISDIRSRVTTESVDPISIVYRQLAAKIDTQERGETTADSSDDYGHDSMFLSPPADGFVTPALNKSERPSGRPSSEPAAEQSSESPPGETHGERAADATTADVADDRSTLTRRSALLLIAGGIGTASAGALSSDSGSGPDGTDSNELVGFGYGGTPITSTATPTETPQSTTEPPRTTTEGSPTTTDPPTEPLQGGSGGSSTSTATPTQTEVETATPTHTATPTPSDDFDDYGEVGYGQGGYGGTV